MDRPDWDTYFLNLAKLVSIRSSDSETKHGAVCIDKHRRIISTGFNGFPRGCRDNELPNTRPEKYSFILNHAETNCLLNAAGRDTWGGTMFVTGQSCNSCLASMCNAGISEVVMANSHGSKLITPETQKIFDLIVEQNGIKVRIVDCKFEYVNI